MQRASDQISSAPSLFVLRACGPFGKTRAAAHTRLSLDSFLQPFVRHGTDTRFRFHRKRCPVDNFTPYVASMLRGAADTHLHSLKSQGKCNIRDMITGS